MLNPVSINNSTGVGRHSTAAGCPFPAVVLLVLLPAAAEVALLPSAGQGCFTWAATCIYRCMRQFSLLHVNSGRPAELARPP